MTTFKTLFQKRRGLLAPLLLPLILLPVLLPSSASAAEPWWHLSSRLIPSSLKPGGEGTIAIRALNVGNGSTAGTVTVSDVLPPGVTIVDEEGGAPGVSLSASHGEGLRQLTGACGVVGVAVTCIAEEGVFPGPRLPFEGYELRIAVRAGAVTEENEARVAGGGANAVSIARPVRVSEAPVAFGVEEFSFIPEEEGGAVDDRAGSHPYQLTSTLTFNRSNLDPTKPPALPRDLHFRLPPGQVANATTVPQCDAEDFSATIPSGPNSCPIDTAIGVAVVTVDQHERGRETTYTVPLFNLTPAYGEPARFGFEVQENPVILDTAVRSGPGEDYGVTVNVQNITQSVAFLSSVVTFWGAPEDPSHNSARGWGCMIGEFWKALQPEAACIPSVQPHPPAYLTLPANCSQPYAPSVEGVSWPTYAAPEGVSFPPLKYQLQDASGNPLALSGCNQLSFAPKVSVAPSSQSASSPSGLDLNVNFDDEGLLAAEGVAQSQLKNTEVVLPEGLTVNPSSGVGLAGCTPADYARETLESPPGAGCPNESKLGTVEIESPLIAQKIHGSVFIAQPYENPFDSLLGLYVVAKNPETGILVKLAGRVEAGGQPGVTGLAPGQLRTTFQNNPQLPFSHFNFHFREGQQAPLITPPTCGSYETSAMLTPWAEPSSTLADTSIFQIASGVGGGACPSGGAPPFNPQIVAGTLNDNAGAFSPFYLRLSRGDADQEISGFSTNMPPGLTGDLTGIPFCPEADIEAARKKTGAEEEANPSCPAASEIGHTLVGTGVGSVLAYVPGKVYLAGPFQGAPFSLVSVTSAKVGPFDLGTVVLRFGLNINPYTAQVSVNPSSSEPIPTILDGIVTHVRDIRVYIERPGGAPFILNPTSCEKMSIASTLTAHEGASATIASPFQAASCANLKFEPKISISTSGKTSKADGASLTFKLTYPNAPLGSQANIAKVKVDLPKQLPSRLTTLQKACTTLQFNTNPAGCPKASFIGHARATTPLIPVPLEGPAIFVSHGGEAFPSLTFVLQGYGITIDLVGQTSIKSGVTSTTFRTIPDEPVGTFEVTLPEGPYSALAANANLCKTKQLLMPTKFTAQNGAQISQDNKIAVTGCKKPLKRKSARRRASRSKRRR
jgi:hypothetical protein